MDEVKKCDHREAIKMLFKGAYVFTRTENHIYQYRKGCRKCNKAMKDGIFCSQCGSKLTENMKVRVGTEVKKFRLHYFGDELYMETMGPKDRIFGERKKCTFTLEFFMKQKHWSWIW